MISAQPKVYDTITLVNPAALLIHLHKSNFVQDENQHRHIVLDLYNEVNNISQICVAK